MHFFWGSFDLAVTRFSGRRAPERAGADPVTREAYSHEVISAGFWPGSGDIKDAAFYAYAAPEPEGSAHSSIRPASAFYHAQMHEFFLMYEDLRKSASPGIRCSIFYRVLTKRQLTWRSGIGHRWRRPPRNRALEYGAGALAREIVRRRGFLWK